MASEPYSVRVDTHDLELSPGGNKLEVVNRSDGKVDERFDLHVDSLGDIGQGGVDGGLQVKVLQSEFVINYGETVSQPLCNTSIDTDEVNIQFDGERLGGIGISDIRQMNSEEPLNLTYFVGACPVFLAVERGDPKILHLFSLCDDLTSRPQGEACMEIEP